MTRPGPAPAPPDQRRVPRTYHTRLPQWAADKFDSCCTAAGITGPQGVAALITAVANGQVTLAVTATEKGKEDTP